MNQNKAALSSVQMLYHKPLTMFVPTLYRYLDKQYVDDFFESGKLRISCFSQFRKHKDEEQGDTDEGMSMPVINDKVNNRSFGIFSVVGHNAYVCSFKTSKGGLPDVFGDAAIEVFEPVGFCNEIANEIAGSQNMMMGFCIYEENHVLLNEGTAPDLTELMTESGENVNLSKIIDKSAEITGPKQFFLKKKKYEYQMEFRMIWLTNKLVNEAAFITIKDPQRFCRRVE